MSDNIIVIMLSLALFFSVVYTVRDVLLKKVFKPSLSGAVVIIKAHGECDNTEALLRDALRLDADEIFIEKGELTEGGERLVGIILREFPCVRILEKDFRSEEV